MAKQTDVDRLRERRECWIKALGSYSEKNTILGQIHDSVYDTAIFKLVQKSIEMSKKNKMEEKVNWAIWKIFRDGHSISLALGVRKLSDDSPKGMDGDKGVNSLVAVLKDMKKVKIRGKDLLDVQGFTYRTWEEEVNIRCGAEQGTKQDRYSGLDELRSRVVEKLCGVTSGSLDKNSVVQDDVFDKQIKKVMKDTEKIKVWVDKHIAHLATDESSEGVEPISDQDVWKALETLCEVANFVSATFLNGSSWVSFLPSMMDDFVFENIVTPLVQKDQVEILKEKWVEIERKVGEWG
ncbi:MAG: hypothetical protein HN370_02080 [Phycisphaerales bacterium]|jgi:hypothetical protein|nr:hypothetical protein [Phycisphaerales bacterium]